LKETLNDRDEEINILKGNLEANEHPGSNHKSNVEDDEINSLKSIIEQKDIELSQLKSRFVDSNDGAKAKFRVSKVAANMEKEIRNNWENDWMSRRASMVQEELKSIRSPYVLKLSTKSIQELNAEFAQCFQELDEDTRAVFADYLSTFKTCMDLLEVKESMTVQAMTTLVRHQVADGCIIEMINCMNEIIDKLNDLIIVDKSEDTKVSVGCCILDTPLYILHLAGIDYDARVDDSGYNRFLLQRLIELRMRKSGKDYETCSEIILKRNVGEFFENLERFANDDEAPQEYYDENFDENYDATQHEGNYDDGPPEDIDVHLLVEEE